ncbi:uncharacterized protein LOC131015058 [Salvia miltiorrhiza]|uniref:uncharacterized protein LOC131015058 n=1 Tax=Salvia miltiorrhiza TaxID=226208 RepID=UPI0025AB9980|nr:uncharacterized protein LOC131015058 [Salvia miltiorrhiza]
MSTRKKEDVSSVREKRGSSPSPSHLKSSPKPSKTVSTSRSLGSSPSSEKATPNYLRPTLSSSHSSGDTAKLQGRRLVSNTDSALKPNLARRRSFDKPPSPTRTLKTRGVSPTPTFRSSSFSGKTGAGRAVTSPKSDRGAKGTRDAGKQHLYARAVGTLTKSATIASKSSKSKKAQTASSRKEDHPSDHLEPSVAEDEEDSVVADQELDSSNEQTTQADTDEDDTLEDGSHKADADADADVDDAAEVESPPTVLEQRDASIGEAESPKMICEESDGNVSKIESPTALGQDDADKVESPTVAEKEEISKNEVESANPDQGEEAEEMDTKPEGEVQEGEVEEDAPRLSHGKKDAALSNNVIEEMTREQRRNKVRALAGAFETVISLQEHNKRSEAKQSND